jgi:hypothetical protein
MSFHIHLPFLCFCCRGISVGALYVLWSRVSSTLATKRLLKSRCAGLGTVESRGGCLPRCRHSPCRNNSPKREIETEARGFWNVVAHGGVVG